MWLIFEKAGEAGWKSIIPIYNLYIMLEIIGLPDSGEVTGKFVTGNILCFEHDGTFKWQALESASTAYNTHDLYQERMWWGGPWLPTRLVTATKNT